MIKALRAAAAKVPFQKDKMASPSRGAALPQPAGRAAWWGATPRTESSCFLTLLSGYNKGLTGYKEAEGVFSLSAVRMKPLKQYDVILCHRVSCQTVHFCSLHKGS